MLPLTNNLDKESLMIRSGHRLYDLRRLLASFKLLAGVLLLGAILVFWLSYDFVYPVALVIAGLFAGRGLIGRRCPHCDGSLHEAGASPDQTDAFVMHITWRCSRDGYEEQEKVKGDSGLFGAN
jgi:hypothetical protein